MNPIIILALVACASSVASAGSIKGQQLEESSSFKGQVHYQAPAQMQQVSYQAAAPVYRDWQPTKRYATYEMPVYKTVAAPIVQQSHEVRMPIKGQYLESRPLTLQQTVVSTQLPQEPIKGSSHSQVVYTQQALPAVQLQSTSDSFKGQRLQEPIKGSSSQVVYTQQVLPAVQLQTSSDSFKGQRLQESIKGSGDSFKGQRFQEPIKTMISAPSHQQTESFKGQRYAQEPLRQMVAVQSTEQLSSSSDSFKGQRLQEPIKGSSHSQVVYTQQALPAVQLQSTSDSFKGQRLQEPIKGSSDSFKGQRLQESIKGSGDSFKGQRFQEPIKTMISAQSHQQTESVKNNNWSGQQQESFKTMSAPLAQQSAN